MADRYFVEAPIDGARARLVGAEAHHLAHVMRAKAGDQVMLFDGSGAEFAARVERVGRSEIELVVLARSEVNREHSVAITLGAALPKQDRARWLVEKAVELGVRRLVPLATERSTERSTAASQARLQRSVIEASKQCGRNRLMEIAAPWDVAEFLAAAPSDSLRLLAHPGAVAFRDVVGELISAGAPPREVWLAIGPEGGLTDAEVEQAVKLGWRVVDFGPRILRVETAALTLVASVMAFLPND
jgi:16S rRNA (uracil1498-N3)-methyltransferase